MLRHIADFARHHPQATARFYVALHLAYFVGVSLEHVGVFIGYTAGALVIVSLIQLIQGE